MAQSTKPRDDSLMGTCERLTGMSTALAERIEAIRCFLIGEDDTRPPKCNASTPLAKLQLLGDRFESTMASVAVISQHLGVNSMSMDVSNRPS